MRAKEPKETMASVQKAESRAESKARKKPMTQTKAELRKMNATDLCSKAWARVVIDAAEKAGADTEEIKTRMRRWYEIVKTYDRDIATLMANKAIDSKERALMLAEMRRNREEVYTEIYGWQL